MLKNRICQNSSDEQELKKPRDLHRETEIKREREREYNTEKRITITPTIEI